MNVFQENERREAGEMAIGKRGTLPAESLGFSQRRGALSFFFSDDVMQSTARLYEAWEQARQYVNFSVEGLYGMETGANVYFTLEKGSLWTRIEHKAEVTG